MKMFKTVINHFCARTSGTVQCKNLSLIDSIKVIDMDHDNVYVQIIERKEGGRMKVKLFVPTHFVRSGDTMIELYNSASGKVVNKITVYRKTDENANQKFDFTLFNYDRMVLTTLRGDAFATFGTLGGTGCAMRLD